MQDLLKLTDKISNHRALNNNFYMLWSRGSLSIDSIAIFVRNYWELTYRFPEVLSILIQNMDDLTSRVEYAKTLFSELGNGDLAIAHSKLFENFCNDLATHSGKHNYLTISRLKDTHHLLDETKKIIEEEKVLYSGPSTIAIGAQLAMEWQAYSMICQLYEGARNYLHLWPTIASFHESCEFFYAHIGATEKQHKLEALRAAQNMILNEENLRDIEYGFNTHLDLIANFWEGIFKKISSQRSI